MFHLESPAVRKFSCPCSLALGFALGHSIVLAASSKHSKLLVVNLKPSDWNCAVGFYIVNKLLVKFLSAFVPEPRNPTGEESEYVRV